MVAFAILSALSMLYSIVYAVHCFRLRRILAAAGALVLALLCLSLAFLMLYLLYFAGKM